MRNRILSTIAVLMSTSTGLAAASAEAAAQAAAGGTFEWHTYAGAEGTRRYKLFVPAGRDASRAAPLVVMLHGCTQDPDDFARGTRFNDAAAAAGVLVAWPEQPAAMQQMKCWSWYDAAHQAPGAGEPALIAAITREAIAHNNADPSRVYVAGVSAGGAMAVNTAAAYPELFAGVAAHSGVGYRAASGVMEALGVMKTGGAAPDAMAAALKTALGSHTLPLMVIHGAADAVVAPVNGRQLFEQWAAARGLAGARTEVSQAGGRAVTRTWYEADGGTALELVLVDGLGHAWSGGSPDGTFTDAQGPDATRLILDFLLSHARK
jgi:poly(hydroxyalkanoate) depolymerase family esterase